MSEDDSSDDVEIEIERAPRDGRAESDRRRSAGGSESPPLEDELGRIHVRTTPEGYVEGRVTDLWSIDATTVGLEVTLPHGVVTTFDLEKPIPWSPAFLLARIVEDVGYDAASVDHLVGEPIYLDRTDAGPNAREEETTEWWNASIRYVGETALSALGGQFRLEDAREPEWRLVDPLERAPDDEGGPSPETVGTVSSLLVVLGTLVAAAGALVGATGALAVSSTVVGYALPGLVLVLTGLYLFSRRGARGR